MSPVAVGASDKEGNDFPLTLEAIIPSFQAAELQSGPTKGLVSENSNNIY